MRQVTAPLATGAGLALLGGYVALRDPATAGWFPPCVLHELTGWWCPACGLTRGTHALLTGDVVGAVAWHPLTPLVVGVIGFAWLAWLITALGRPVRWRPVLSPRAGAVALSGVLVFGILRNLPGFGAIAP